MSKAFRPREDPRPEMEKALDRAIELSVGSRRYRVTAGRLLYEQHRRYRYTFTLVEGSWDLTDGTDLQLSGADLAKPLPVELSSTKDDTVTIIVRQRLTEHTLANAQLAVERAFLLRRLKEALLREATKAQLGLKLFGVLDCPDGEAEEYLIEKVKDVFPADEAQQLALRRALYSALLVILGSPGTGKTDVLAAIALLHATLFGHRVLIVSHTNIAIDNAIVRLANFFRQCGLERWLDQQRLIRFGDPHLAVLEEDAYRTITMPLIVADRVAQSRDEIAHLEQRRATLLKQLTDHRDELPEQVQAWQQRAAAFQRKRKKAEHALASLEAEEQARLTPIMAQLTPRLEQRAREEEIMEDSRADWEEADHQLRAVQHSYQERRTPYTTAHEKLERLRKQWWFVRLVRQAWTGEWEKELKVTVQTLAGPLHRLAQQMAALQRNQARAAEAYHQAKQRRDTLAPAIAYWERERDARPAHAVEQHAALTGQISDLTKELDAGNPRIAEIERDIASWEKEVTQLEETLAHLDQHIAEAKREAAQQVVEEAQIVGATLTALYLNPHLLNQEWDVVVIDEASMAPPPAVKVAANRARQHLIIVGDPHQLAPVCKFKDDLVRRWLGRDVFFHGRYTLDEARQGTHHCVLLPYQSRMHTDICDLVRWPVYKGLLKDRNPLAPRPPFQPEPSHAVVLYDTGNSGLARAKQPKSGQSRYNEYHAEIDLILAQQVLAGIPESERYAEYIGIVTPYAAQRDHLRERIQGMDLEIYCRIGTVHAFQGLEFNALIFDLVESPGLSIAPFLRGGWGSESMRLLNVAVTRARHKLLIVANLRHIRKEPSWSLLPQIMTQAAQKQCISSEALKIFPLLPPTELG
jgi:AAA domain